MSVPEAMTLYVDMMVKLLTNGVSVTTTNSTSTTMMTTPTKVQKYSDQRKGFIMSPEHKIALRKIEGLICTSRESLLGSSAWKGEFYEQLKSRPFYTVLEVYYLIYDHNLFISLC